MGDPKFSRRKYDTPAHPWEGDRIKEENELLMKYGLKNKRELWRAQSFVRTLRAHSRELQARVRTGDKQAGIGQRYFPIPGCKIAFVKVFIDTISQSGRRNSSAAADRGPG